VRGLRLVGEIAGEERVERARERVGDAWEGEGWIWRGRRVAREGRGGRGRVARKGREGKGRDRGDR